MVSWNTKQSLLNLNVVCGLGSVSIKISISLKAEYTYIKVMEMTLEICLDFQLLRGVYIKSCSLIQHQPYCIEEQGFI